MNNFRTTRRAGAAAALLALLASAALAQGSDIAQRNGFSGGGFGEAMKPFNEAVLPLIDQQPPKEMGQDAEVLIVSGYAPSQPLTRVVVSRPYKKVVLVLSSYEKMLWKVEVAPHTTVSGVLLASHAGASAVTSLAAMPVYSVKLPYATSVDNANYTSLMRSLNQWLGVSRADVFRGSYQVSSIVELNQLDPQRPELTLAGVAPTVPAKVFSFELLTRDFGKLSFTNVGPVSPEPSGRALMVGTQQAVSPSGQEIYDIRDGHDTLFVTDRATGETRRLNLPANFPQFSWATGVAYDTQRNVVTVVTLGGEGFLYRYDTKRESWIDYRSLNNVDIHSFAYDAIGKRYVAWTREGELLMISSDGALLSRRPQVSQKLKGFGTLYDAGNGPAPTLMLAPRGPDIALVYTDGNVVSQVWSYDEKTDSAELTYKRGVPARR